MLNRADSLQIDSLKSIIETCGKQQDSLNSIIKANTSVVDSYTANINLAVDSLTNHIQICQNQIDSIAAHAEPMKHLGYWIVNLFDSLGLWIQSILSSGLDKIFTLKQYQSLQGLDLGDKLICTYFYYVILLVLVYGIIYRVFRAKIGCKKRVRKLKPFIWLCMHKFWMFVICIVTFPALLPIYFVDYICQLYRYFGLFGLFGGNRIKRHRELYAKDGRSLLWFSAKGAFFVPFVLWLVLYLFGHYHSSNLGIWTNNPEESTNVLWSIICQYLDPGNVAYSNDGGSIIALVSALLGIVCLSGFLVSAIVNVISQTRLQWQKGLIDYYGVKKFKGYVVIIGINEQTASIARRALESDDNRYVLIQTRQDVEKVRPELESKIDDDKQDRIVYYAGDRTSYEDIEKLHLEKAIEVYILGESVENTGAKNNDEQVEKEHDAYNISCLEQISEYIKQKREKSQEEAKKKLENAKKKLENAEKKLENAEKKLENAENKGAKEKEIKKYEEECKKCRDKYDKIFNTPRLNVHVQFDYQSTFTAFKATHLYQKLGRDIRFIPFNIHELWAKKVLVDNLAIYPAGNKTELKVQRYRPIDGKDGIGIEKDHNEEKTVHLIIIGMNQMGTALATQAALLCHFPNFARDKSKKTVITFIDDNAIREAEYYMGRYTTLFELSYYRIGESEDGELKWKKEFNPFENGEYNHLITKDDKEVIKKTQNGKETKIEKPCLLDVEWEFIEGNAASKPVQDYIRKIVDNKQKIVTIAICFNDSQQSLAAAMYLPKTVYDHCNQVLVYQRSIFDVAKDVAEGDSDWRRYKNLFPFGMSEASYTENPFDSHLAALDYYMYENEKRFEQVKNYFDETEEYADEQKKHEFEASILKSVDDAWENAGIVRKTASIDSVDSIPFKLRSMGIEYCRDLDKIEEKISKEEYKEIKDGIVEAEHNRWMMQRLISGFRPFTKDEQKYVEDLRTLIKEVRNNIKLENSKFIHKLNELRDVFLKEINNEKEKKYRKEEFDRIINDVVKIKSDEKKVNDLLNSIGRVIEHRIDEKKDGERASYYICSFKRMDELEKDVNEKDRMASNDKSVIKSIPILLRVQELLNVLMLTSDDERYKHSQHKKILEEIFKEKFLWIEGRKEECNEEDKVYCEHAFRMADTAVSRKQWQDVTGKQLCKNKDENELPVVSVSKKDVEDFLDILRKKSGLYFDLPSIKEWRTAADSGFADNNSKNWNCKHSSKDEKELMPVIEKKTDKKLHHFFGNVWEWTHKMDEHGKGLYKFVGGSFRFGEKECSPAIDQDNKYWCHSWDADSKSDDLGFRLVWKYDRGILSVDANADAKEEEGKAKTQRNEMSGAIEKWFKGKEHKFVKVDSGYFVMGADKNPNGDLSKEPDANEGPRHTVRISEPFYICQVPVTQSLWNAVMKEKKPRLNPTTNRIGDEIPQTDVSWEMIVDIKDHKKGFIDKLNEELKNNKKYIIDALIDAMFPEYVEDDEKKKEEWEKKKDVEKRNLEKCIGNGYKFRLPTEAEWEYAAKGGMEIQEIKENDFKENGAFIPVPIEKDKKGGLKTSDKELYVRKKIQYPLYATRKDGNAIDFAWFDQPSIHEVAQKEPNALGLYDMSGNVWEWCYDYYIAEMYELCIHGNKGEDKKDIKAKFIKKENSDEYIAVNPVAQDSGYSAHVFRGGSWRSSKWDCRCTRANYWGENYKANDLGFRLVLGVPISELGKAEKEKNTVNTETSEQS